MESLLNSLHCKGQTLETDPTLRLPNRPMGNLKTNPKAFEDLGSSLAPRNNQAPPKSKPKPRSAVSSQSTRSLGIKKPVAEFMRYESEDELDLLSSSQAEPDDYQPSSKASVSKPVEEKAKEHGHDLNLLRRKSKVLAGLRFNKIKKVDGEESTFIPSSPEISISTPKKKDGTSSQPLCLPMDFPMDVISPLGGKVQQKPLPKSVPKPLPKPRNKVNPPSFEASIKLNAFPMPSPQSSDKVRTGAASQSIGKNKAQPFPLYESDEDEADEESDYDEGKKRAKGKGRQKRPKDFPMDMISPLRGKKSLPKRTSEVKPPSVKASCKLRAFPMPSPQSSDKARSKGKTKAQPSPLPNHQKRLSEACSEAKRKRRSSLSPSQYSFEDEDDSITISPDTDPHTLCPYCDTPLPSSPSPLLINILAATRKKSIRDPRPSNPLGLKAPLTIFIVACQRHKFESQILPEAERKGWPKTIQWKKLGARVERMKDELQALIEDPGGDRDDVDDDIDEVERLFRDDGDQNVPKARSIFWTEVMDEVKKKGSRAVVGVRGQFANFEKTQPGYYGEQGSVIIHQTLFDMFPPASFDPARISPLTSNEFVSRILVPEVALRLIMEDRYLEGNDGMHQALVILRESSTYGVAMFPEDAGEGSTGKKRRDDVMGVGDKIVMERARKRRKELEEEEEQEESEEARTMAEMDAGAERKQVKAKENIGGKKRKGKQREQQLEKEQPPVERPRPRPRPIAKASSSKNVQPPSDHEEPPPSLQPSAQHQSPPKQRRTRGQSRARSIYSGMDTDPSDGFSSRPMDLSASESDDYHRLISEEQSHFASESMLKQKPSSTRAASKDLGVLDISDSDASLGSGPSIKPATRRSLRKHAMERSDSKMDMDLYDGDDSEDDVSLEGLLNTKTPVGKHTSPFADNHREVNDIFIDEETPKLKLLKSVPRIGESNDIKPLMVARIRRQFQKTDSESNSREADSMPHRTFKLGSDESNYSWLLNDTSQSSMEGKSTLKRT